MAEMVLTVVVSPLMEVVFDKLRSPILRKFGSLYGINDDLEKLSSALSRIRAVLVDAEKKQITDEATKDWLGKIKDAAYEADDIIDEWATKALFSLDSGVNLASSSSSAQAGKSFLSSINFKPLRLRRKIAKRIKKIVTKFDDIAAEKDKFQLKEGVLESSVIEIMQQRETSSVLCEPFVYGRSGDKENFIRLLLSHSNGGNDLQVYPIVGIGGLGKTTFAQLIYSDESIVEAFTTRIWICISEDFSVKRLIKKIIASLSEAECKFEDLDPLQNHLKQLLNGRKFLLVLDDVWNEDPETWERLRFSLKGGANGSSVVVTTRLHTVAKIMGTHSAYDLTTLSDDDCWALFKGRAFGTEGEVVESLEEIGKQIVKKCGGVPLVAKTLGGSLRFERDASMWMSIRDNEIWKLEQDKGSILPCLKLSYDHLPSYLRECFVYCCVFPKDHEMEVEELIQLWMANGFLESNGRLGLEEAGNHIFNQLVLRSFLQDVSVSEGDGKQVCKMHDLMHDLACSVAGRECHAFEGGDNSVTIPETLLKSHPSLRTCLYPTFEIVLASVKIIFKNQTSLRALHLTIDSPSLPQSIGKMIHLRYLNISSSRFKHLPKSICRLKNLQTLDLHYCENLQKMPKSISKLANLRYLNLSECGGLIQLPDGIGELVNLRHLNLRWCSRLIELPEGVGDLINLRYMYLSNCKELTHLPQRIGKLVKLIHLDLDGCSSLIEMPIGIGRLSRLETLGSFVVSPEDSGGSNIRELHGLNHLGGDLEIRGLEDVRNGAESEQANLVAKKNLSSLDLVWNGEKMSSNREDVMQGLQPCHDNLQRLCIEKYGGRVFPSWMKLLVNLVAIRLWFCSKCEDLPPLGHLPLLKELFILGMDSLKRINKEFYGISSSSRSSGAGESFPSLEYLSFDSMPNWEEWESLDQQQLFPSLEQLSLADCPNLASLPFSILHSVQKLVLQGNCEKLMVTSLPCVRVLDLHSFSSVGSLQNLDSLELLRLYNCKFARIPQFIKNLASLKYLEIKSCLFLTSLSQCLQHLSSLNTLCIIKCHELEFSSGDFQHLLALQTLYLSSLPKIISLPDIPTLRTLKIYGCQNLQVLSHSFQNLHTLTIKNSKKLKFSSRHLLALQTLNLSYLPQLVSFPNIPTLQTLRIHLCQNLKVFPQSFQNLTTLHTLQIKGCDPDLETKCKKDIGEYWPYISNIQQLDISSVCDIEWPRRE